MRTLKMPLEVTCSCGSDVCILAKDETGSSWICGVCHNVLVHVSSRARLCTLEVAEVPAIPAGDPFSKVGPAPEKRRGSRSKKL